MTLKCFFLFVTQGDNIMHSTGTSKSDAEVHGGLAFSVVRAHTAALDREVGADRGRELADVGRFKMLFME